MRIAFVLLIVSFCAQAQSDRYLTKALAAEKWIRAQEVSDGKTLRWRTIEGDTTTSAGLYSGSAGVVLFYLELYNITKQADFLTKAKLGADYLLATLGRKLEGYEEVGLYTGEAGILFTLKKIAYATHESKYELAYHKSFARLQQQAKINGSSADFRFTDVVYGGAGIGLALLDLKDKEAKKLAVKVGEGLINSSVQIEGGRKWFMDSAMQRQQYYMPNFSHGTAGVSYFLSKLYQETSDKRFLKAALEGASHLALLENKDAWVYHHDKADGKDLYYLSWCHGPAGTARLYYQLYQITKDKVWVEKIKKAAAALLVCGLPEKQTPGLWNNTGACCGTAGVAEFFLDLYKTFGDQEYLDFARHITDDLMIRSTTEGEQAKWILAEHRRQPNLLNAQTGYMQGASGIGMWLLHLYCFDKKIKPLVKLPDNPF